MRANFIASKDRSWSAFHVYGLQVLSRWRRGAFSAATSVENPASCSTKPMNERSSDILVGRGNCDNDNPQFSLLDGDAAVLNVVTDPREPGFGELEFFLAKSDAGCTGGL